MIVKDLSNKDIGIYLVSAYSPDGNDNRNIWDNFLKNMEQCINLKQKGDL